VTPNRPSARGIPVEDFLQAIGEQLDRAQDALAIKARTGRPLTWALREFKIALQVFVDVDPQGQVTWRSAGPNEAGASTVNLEFTTITRPMIEENTYSVLDETDARPIDHIGGAAELTDDERQRLRRLGVRNVGQLRRLSPHDAPKLEAIGEMVDALVSGEARFPERGRSSRPPPPPSFASSRTRSFGTTRIRFAHDETTGVMTLTVEATDRPGLLLSITKTLFGAGVQIVSLRATTDRGRAVDTFHLVELDGKPLARDRLFALQNAVLSAIDAATPTSVNSADELVEET